MPQPSLDVKDVAVSRGGLRVLEGVTFTISPGNALVVRGPNGVGKTTLLRCVAGLQPTEAGEIFPDPSVIAYAGHRDGIKAVMTVTETLAFWASLHGAGAIEPALETFDLLGLADRPARHLSAGQARRLGLARLMVTGRPVWALDEPTVSLDTSSIALFAAAVRRHLDGGGAALIATHAELGLSAASLDLSTFRARRSTISRRLTGFEEPVT